MVVAAVWTELQGILVSHGGTARPDTRHVLGEVVHYQAYEGVTFLKFLDHVAAVNRDRSDALQPRSWLLLLLDQAKQV